MWVKIYNYILDVLFPVYCVYCGVWGHLICCRCRQKTIKVRSFEKNIGQLDKLFIFSDFNDPVICELIHQMKYQGMYFIAVCLGEMMAEKFHPQGKEEVVYVPMHPQKYRQRGYNQSQIMAQSFSRRAGLAFFKDGLLKKLRNTASQMELDRKQRLVNLKDAFAMNGKAKNITYVIIDDVYTTGSTLSECAALLKKSGAFRVVGVVFSAKDGVTS